MYLDYYETQILIDDEWTQPIVALKADHTTAAVKTLEDAINREPWMEHTSWNVRARKRTNSERPGEWVEFSMKGKISARIYEVTYLPREIQQPPE